MYKNVMKETGNENLIQGVKLLYYHSGLSE